MRKMEQIIKRDGRKVKFDVKKIASAIKKALKAANIKDNERAEALAKQVEDSFEPAYVPTVEEIQDKVEEILI